jgi:hypothetical protein
LFGAATEGTHVACVVFADHTAVLDAGGDANLQPGSVVMMPLLGRSIGAASTLDLRCQADPDGVGIDAFMVATKIGVIHDAA